MASKLKERVNKQVSKVFSKQGEAEVTPPKANRCRFTECLCAEGIQTKESGSSQYVVVDDDDQYTHEIDEGHDTVAQNKVHDPPRSMDVDSSAPQIRKRKERRRVTAKATIDIQPRRKGHLPCGPTDLSLLTSFDAHVACDIWNGEERGPLRCHARTRAFNAWALGEPPYKKGSWQQIADGTGLGHLGSIMFSHTNRSLISAFVERWHPETNSFHMPFGEMTIMLHDVLFILGLPIDGKVVKLERGYERSVIGEHLAKLLWKTSEEVVLELKRHKPLVSAAWLEDEASNSELPPESVAILHLLYMIGVTVFVDKSGICLDPIYIALLDDLDNVKGYAWGAATLAYLYRHLGTASRAGCRQIGGCMTLLQGWIYEYFPDFRPSMACSRPASATPRAARWVPRPEPPADLVLLRSYRYKLDHMKASEVQWMPYGRMNLNIPQIRMTCFHGFIQCMSIVEPYMPDRCTRQIGYQQAIPSKPFTPQVARRYREPGSYVVEFAPVEELWHHDGCHRLRCSQLGKKTVSGFEVYRDYMSWCASVSHLKVQNDKNAQTGYARCPRPGPCTRCLKASELMMPYWVERQALPLDVMASVLAVLNNGDPHPPGWQGYFEEPSYLRRVDGWAKAPLASRKERDADKNFFRYPNGNEDL